MVNVKLLESFFLIRFVLAFFFIIPIFSVSAGQVEDLTNSVLSASPKLAEEKARKEALQEDALSFKAKKLPQIKINSQQFVVKSETDSGFLANVQLEVPIFDKGKIPLLIKIAELESKSYSEFQKKMILERLREFKASYFELSVLKEVIPILKKERKLLTKVIKREEALVGEKLKLESELFEYKNKMLSLRGDIKSVTARRKILWAKINYLTGLKINREILCSSASPADPSKYIEKFDDIDFMQHPDTARLTSERSKQQAKVEVARKENLPEVSLFSSYARDPRFDGNEDQVFNGLSLRWNIWDFGSNQHLVNKENKLLAALDAKLMNRKKELLLEAQQAFEDYSLAHTVWSIQKEFFLLQEKALQNWRNKFKYGYVSLNKYCLKELELLHSKKTMCEAKIEAFKRQMDLEFVMGILPSETGK